jgi:hypothetical protein
MVKPDAPAPEWCSSTGRCSRWLLREPQPPARSQNWSGSLQTLTVPANRVGGVCAGGCELACSPRRYQPLRGASLAYGFAAGHRLRPLHPHRACRDAYTTTSPALGAGRAATRGGRRRGQQCFLCEGSRRNVNPDNDFSLRGSSIRSTAMLVGLLASLRGRRACISAVSMNGAGGRSQRNQPR